MSGSAAAAGSDLGDVDAIVLRLPEGVTTPVYVERVEVIATPGGGRSSAPPLRWTATYRGWLVPPSGEAGNSGAAAGGVAGEGLHQGQVCSCEPCRLVQNLRGSHHSLSVAVGERLSVLSTDHTQTTAPC
jgi:hypothetical protein